MMPGVCQIYIASPLFFRTLTLVPQSWLEGRSEMILRFLNKRVDPLLIKLPPLVAAVFMWALLPGALLLIRQWREGGMYLPFWAVPPGRSHRLSPSGLPRITYGPRTWTTGWTLDLAVSVADLVTSAALRRHPKVHLRQLAKRHQDGLAPAKNAGFSI